MKSWLLISFLLFMSESMDAQSGPGSIDAGMLHRSEKALTDIIVHDIFSPPVASRIYAYANIAAYEVLTQGTSKYKSLSGILRSLPVTQKPVDQIDIPLAALYSFLLTARKLVFSEKAMDDSIKAILTQVRKRKLSTRVYNASLAYGKQVSDGIIQWFAKDQYKETRALRRYQYRKAEGNWTPTPPGYMAAVEPYWGRMRTLAIDSGSQFKPATANNFSKDTSSIFFQQALEVYQVGKNLTPEQRAIANFWDCNPFFLNTGGHLNFATKKISPGGHWISIAGILCRQEKADLVQSSAVYTYLSIAMYDAFISCWDEKYRSNVIRPETYINSYIDESWRPILQTPPFPEYPSGHSVISTAAAVVLEKLFRENLSFIDDSEVEFGLPVRTFKSIRHACEEAAISRLYGGIHYRAAIDQGKLEGERIGMHITTNVIDKVWNR